MKKELRLKVWGKYNKKCAYCGCELAYKDMQVDHIESKLHHKMAGKTNEDRLENLNPSCRQCNFYKGGGTLDLFRKQLSTLDDRLNKIFIFRLAVKHGIVKLRGFDNKFHFEKKHHE